MTHHQNYSHRSSSVFRQEQDSMGKEAYHSGRTVRQVALEQKVLPENLIEELLGDKKGV